MKNKLWTSADDSLLRKLYVHQQHYTHAELGTILNRTENAIEIRCRHFKLRRRKKWTTDEDQVIVDHKVLPSRMIAELLEGRSLRSVARRRVVLGVRR